MDLAGFCFRCHQPFYGEHCPRCDEPPAPTATEVVQQLFAQAQQDNPGPNPSLRVTHLVSRGPIVLVRTGQGRVIDVFTVAGAHVSAHTQQPDPYPDLPLEGLLPQQV
ncbi:MAG: hypothetical protein M3Z04_25075 [Chloroflexota bacterium]|nr:hypothetical protein [Chloroflexota bacterium]